MLPSADAKFNYAILPMEKAASARAAAERIRGRMQLAAESIIEVGRELIEQKAALGHGNFLPWIDAEFGMSDETARKYMRVASEVGDKFQPSWNLPVSALYALTAPSTPEPVRTEVLERAANGEKVTAKEIEALKKKLSKAEDLAAKAAESATLMEGRAQTVERELEGANLARLYAEQDKQRLANELADLEEEVARLKEPGVITLDPVQSFNEAFVSTPIQETPWTDNDAQARLIQYAWEKATPLARTAFMNAVGLEPATPLAA